jgi:DNA-binding GntR family transcriptional regulator
MKLNPAAIGAELGVSRTPVREALQRLDLEGLVTVSHHRGAVVTRLTLDEVRELFRIRAALEGLAAAEAARSIDQDALDECELLARRLERAQGDIREWFIRHEAFHDRLYEFAGMPRLSAEIRRFREAVQPYLRLYIDVYSQLEMPGVEHRRLLAAFAKGSADRAGEAIRQHVEHAAEGVLEFLAQGGPDGVHEASQPERNSAPPALRRSNR